MAAISHPGVRKVEREIVSDGHNLLLKGKETTNVSIDDQDEFTQAVEHGVFTKAESDCFKSVWKLNSKINSLATSSQLWGYLTASPGMPKLDVVLVEDD